ncbi:MAG: 3-dehydroquinate synthase [Eubacterium sp.]|nr:3-dehydroquinate synthase [Eubacterium sp.]
MSENLKALPVYENGKQIYNIVYSNDFEGLKDFYKTYNPDGSKKICIVSDSRVASCYMDAILDITQGFFSKTISFVFPEGEQSKNLDTVKDVYIKLIEEHFDRHDLLMALGGGVTGDMCGYTAATYLRGIDFIQVPTSLLADVDSSIGGKTGVDFDAYKNMVGAFHMPKLVYINLSTLNTLSQRQFYSGMGEVVKSALIKNADLFESLCKMGNINELSNKQSNSSDNSDHSGTYGYSHEDLYEIISCCNIIKKNVVEEDPHETKGERALLNFGHTLGHAIEKYMNFNLLHGECVSIGCIMASIISRNKGLISSQDVDKIANYILGQYNLPDLKLNENDIDQIIAITHSDKKAIGNQIKFILLDSIGNAVIRKDVSDQDMKIAINEYMDKYSL